jgi:hypothetical protein
MNLQFTVFSGSIFRPNNNYSAMADEEDAEVRKHVHLSPQPAVGLYVEFVLAEFDHSTEELGNLMSPWGANNNATDGRPSSRAAVVEGKAVIGIFSVILACYNYC